MNKKNLLLFFLLAVMPQMGLAMGTNCSKKLSLLGLDAEILLGSTLVRFQDRTMMRNFVSRNGSVLQDLATVVRVLWRTHYSDSPVEVNIELRDLSFSSLRERATYDIDDKKLRIYLGEMIRNPIFIGKEKLKKEMILSVAHEMTHFIQHRRGEPLIATHENPDYPNDPLEREARMVSLDLLKAFYPESQPSFRIGGEVYFAPKISSYGLLPEFAKD